MTGFELSSAIVMVAREASVSLKMPSAVLQSEEKPVLFAWSLRHTSTRCLPFATSLQKAVISFWQFLRTFGFSVTSFFSRSWTASTFFLHSAFWICSLCSRRQACILPPKPAFTSAQSFAMSALQSLAMLGVARMSLLSRRSSFCTSFWHGACWTSLRYFCRHSRPLPLSGLSMSTWHFASEACFCRRLWRSREQALYSRGLKLMFCERFIWTSMSKSRQLSSMRLS
mmetsp:Transcript_123/g.407  ORF Transcript_123/g.407 Transcript_123/m.407 type:complete len:227 (-) Transcript_123:2108-2788(-)